MRKHLARRRSPILIVEVPKDQVEEDLHSRLYGLAKRTGRHVVAVEAESGIKFREFA